MHKPGDMPCGCKTLKERDKVRPGSKKHPRDKSDHGNMDKKMDKKMKSKEMY